MAKTTKVGIYTRVSTDGQNTEGQESELKEYAKNRGWEVGRIYRDKISGTTTTRPGLSELMTDAKKRKFSAVLVWRFDRFARSVSHLLQALETFRAVGIDFVSISEQVDTSTPTGKMVFTVLGAVAELERSLIVERVRMGLQNARKHGKRIGRPPIRRLSTVEMQKVKADKATGKFSLRKLAAKYGTSLWAMQQATTGGNQRI
jgi:DNA invertase Pin-like site-specific DNA recombinase